MPLHPKYCQESLNQALLLLLLHLLLSIELNPDNLSPRTNHCTDARSVVADQVATLTYPLTFNPMNLQIYHYKLKTTWVKSDSVEKSVKYNPLVLVLRRRIRAITKYPFSTYSSTVGRRSTKK